MVTLVTGESVGATRHPDGAPGVGLVPHGVGKALHGSCTVDDVAVVMEAGVQVWQRQRSTALEDLEAQRSERRTGDRSRLHPDRRERRPPHRRRSSSLLPGDDRPEPLPELVQLVQRGEAVDGQATDSDVELVDQMRQLVPPDLQGDSGSPTELGVPAVRMQAPSGDVRGPVASQRASGRR